MNFFEGILLGLSTGTVCLAYCGPILLPYLLAERGAWKRNVLQVSLFLGGRFLAYLVTGLLAGILGLMLFSSPAFRLLAVGCAYLVLSVVLVFYAFHRFKQVCMASSSRVLRQRLGELWKLAVPLVGGLVSGINLCPPFVLAITQASAQKNIWGSMLFFVAFFLGTSLFFVPLPFLSLVKKREVLGIIGKFAAGIAGAVYFFKGLLMLVHYFSLS